MTFSVYVLSGSQNFVLHNASVTETAAFFTKNKTGFWKTKSVAFSLNSFFSFDPSNSRPRGRKPDSSFKKDEDDEVDEDEDGDEDDEEGLISKEGLSKDWESDEVATEGKRIPCMLIIHAAAQKLCILIRAPTASRVIPVLKTSA
jgi:hypothetical protein